MFELLLLSFHTSSPEACFKEWILKYIYLAQLSPQGKCDGWSDCYCNEIQELKPNPPLTSK